VRELTKHFLSCRLFDGKHGKTNNKYRCEIGQQVRGAVTERAASEAMTSRGARARADRSITVAISAAT